MNRRKWIGPPGGARVRGIALVLTLLACQRAESQHYYAYVAAESEDMVYLLHFNGERASVAQEIPVGSVPVEIEGPHGIAVDPSGRYWFVSIAHGNPYGTLHRYETVSNRSAGAVELGLFPATIAVSSDTGMLYIANFNLHGDMHRSSVSVVDPVAMTELAETTTGIMPHGGRFSADGRMHYSVGMMDGTLYEIDSRTFEVTRSLDLVAPDAQSAGRRDGAHGDVHAMDGTAAALKPTWATPHPTRPVVFVAANGADRILEVDTRSWRVERTFSTQRGPYNVEVSPDGKWLVVTHKSDQTTGIVDAESGETALVVRNSRPVPHGIAITNDSRFAFVSAEGVGSEPGAVDVIDLRELRIVTSVDVGRQAGGIVFWRSSEEPVELE